MIGICEERDAVALQKKQAKEKKAEKKKKAAGEKQVKCVLEEVVW